MTVVSREKIKSWFRKGLKPLEVHFASWIDSFWHKNDAIPMSSIDGLNEALNQRTITIDEALSESSTNPVQNKVVTEALGGKANVEHTHLMSEVDGLPETLDDKAAVDHNHDAAYASRDHSHTMSDIEGLVNALAGKSNTGHAHTPTDITGLTDYVNNLIANAEKDSLPTLLISNVTSEGGVIVSASFTSEDVELGNLSMTYFPVLTSYGVKRMSFSGLFYSPSSTKQEIYMWRGKEICIFTRSRSSSSDSYGSTWEASEQDITKKQDKTDNSLLTTDKTVIGAINELWTKFKDYLKGIQHVTYAQLKTMRDSGTLVAGQWYRITDYMTTVANDPEARSAGHPFDLLVMATSVNTLSELAKAINSSRDSNGYFAEANLNAWKIWYCLDNDTTRFQWADTENGNGVIWRMIDEWQNDCPYDFKNVQFKRYAITDDSPHGELEALNWKYYGYNGEMKDVHIEDENDFVWAYTFTLIDENDEWVDYSIKKEGALDAGTDWGYLKQFKIGRCEYNRIRNIYVAVTIDDQCYRTLMLNNIVLISTISEENGLSGEMQLNEFGTGNYNMTLKDNPEKNIFGSKCYNNIAGSYSNTFGNYCSSNTFGNNCYSNTFGNNCYHNTFGNGCGGNTFGNNCNDNTFGNGCYYNTFGNNCYHNTFGNNCYSNTFGNDCNDNTFGNDCGGNTFGNNCNDNTFGNYCSSNTFGNNCRYITVHNSVQYVAVTGGSTDSSYVQNAQILNGTHGSNTSNRLQISFQEGVDYCQFAGLNSSGILKIWVPSDAA